MGRTPGANSGGRTTGSRGADTAARGLVGRRCWTNEYTTRPGIPRARSDPRWGAAEKMGPGMTDEAFDRLEEAAETVARRAEWERANRVGLLWVHVGIGVFAGAQMLAFGSAGNIEALVGIWSRAALGFLGLTGGLVLALGIHRRKRHRAWWLELEAFGLALLGAWDLLMAAGMAAARIQAGDFSMRALTEPLPAAGTYALPYPISVYLGLFGLICVHLWTLRRFKRGR